MGPKHSRTAGKDPLSIRRDFHITSLGGWFWSGIGNLIEQSASRCIPHLHDSLKTLGTMMGSGGMIVMDDTSDMVDVARYFMEFCMTESCGKCIPCRTGTQQMHGLLDRIAKSEGSRRDLALLEELCDVVQATSLCGLGQTAPNPVLSTLRHFRAEYEAKLGGG